MAKTMTMPLRESVAAMIETVATQRPDILPTYLDLAFNSPARFAVLELVSDFQLKNPRDLCQAALKAASDLDRLERSRGPWTHPKQVVKNPNLQGLLYFCRARMETCQGLGRRRRLEVTAQKLERALNQERSYDWVTEFLAEESVKVPAKP